MSESSPPPDGPGTREGWSFAIAEPTPEKKPRTALIAVGAALVALLVGILLGYASRGGEVDDLNDQIDTTSAEAADLAMQLTDAEEQLADRASKKAADEAAARRLEQEQAAKERADEEAAAEAQAEAQRQAEAAAAEAQRQAAADAAAAEEAAQARRRIPGGEGIFAVGPDIDAGRWRTTSNSSCYYAILSSPSGEGISNIIENNNISGPAIVDLRNGTYFELSNCGEWFHE
jgi:hypothetical protein